MLTTQYFTSRRLYIFNCVVIKVLGHIKILIVLGEYMISRIVCLGLVFYFGHCSANEVMVYRWVDKNNIVHFSQHQPVGNEYTEFLVSNQSKLISRADNTGRSSTSTKSLALDKSEAEVPSTINMSEQCKEAKNNLSKLLAFDKLQYTDDKGIKQLLNEKEKQQQLALNKKRTEVYCASQDDDEY